MDAKNTNPIIRIALSIKYLKTGLTEDQYRKIYTELIDDYLTTHQCLFIKDVYQELDKHNILHLHGVLEAPKHFNRWELLRPGFNVHYKPIVNEFGWTMYSSNYGSNKRFECFSIPNENYVN